jgi:hypothetical protein
MTRPLFILVSGPYRSGTSENLVLVRANLRRLEDAALKLFWAGHVPFLSEWVALPLLKVAGSKKPDDHRCNEIMHPVAARLILTCDAVLRLPGESKGADGDVRIAKQNNIPVYYELADLLNL